MNKRKDKKKHDFWKKIHFKYKVSIINENTLSEVWKKRVSWFSGFVIVFAFAVTVIILTSVIIISTPIRNYLPGYLDSEIREQAIKSAIQVDSLETTMKYQSAYLNNIIRAFNGQLTDSIAYKPDSLLADIEEQKMGPSKIEEGFREKYEEEEKYNLNTVSSTLPVAGVTFFRPVKGLITRKYDVSAMHYGVSMLTNPKESVVAALEGTVIFSGYDSDANYVIQIQHKNGFVSIYKKNALLLKKTGERVSTGEAIAIAGNNEESKSNLYFELWYKGSPVNPENYISFK